MKPKKQTEGRRSPIARRPATPVDRFLGQETAEDRQEQVSRTIRQAQEGSKGKRNKLLADRRRSRLILDLSRFADYRLAERVEDLCRERSIPPSSFVALCIELGLRAVENRSLDLDDYTIAYDARNQKFKNTLALEKESSG